MCKDESLRCAVCDSRDLTFLGGRAYRCVSCGWEGGDSDYATYSWNREVGLVERRNQDLSGGLWVDLTVERDAHGHREFEVPLERIAPAKLVIDVSGSRPFLRIHRVAWVGSTERLHPDYATSYVVLIAEELTMVDISPTPFVLRAYEGEPRGPRACSFDQWGDERLGLSVVTALDESKLVVGIVISWEEPNYKDCWIGPVLQSDHSVHFGSCL